MAKNPKGKRISPGNAKKPTPQSVAKTAKPTVKPPTNAYVTDKGKPKFQKATVTGKDAAGNTLLTRKSGDTMAVNEKGRRLAVNKKGNIITNERGKQVTVRSQQRQAERAAAQEAKAEKRDDRIAEARRVAGIHRTSPMQGMGMAPSRSARDAEAKYHKLRVKRKRELQDQKIKDVARGVAKKQVAKAVAQYVPTTKPATTTTTTPPKTTTTTTPPKTTTPAPKPPTPPPAPPPDKPAQGASRGLTPTFRGSRQTGGGGGNAALGGAQGIQRVGSAVSGSGAGQAENRKGGNKYRFM